MRKETNRNEVVMFTTRRETNTVVDADPRPYGDAKSKRNAEDYDRKTEELASARKFLQCSVLQTLIIP
jgi:hypothetical protein